MISEKICKNEKLYARKSKIFFSCRFLFPVNIWMALEKFSSKDTPAAAAVEKAVFRSCSLATKPSKFRRPPTQGWNLKVLTEPFFWCHTLRIHSSPNNLSISAAAARTMQERVRKTRVRRISKSEGAHNQTSKDFEVGGYAQPGFEGFRRQLLRKKPRL